MAGALYAGFVVNAWRNDAAQLEVLQAQVEQTRHELAIAAAKAEEEGRQAAEVSALLQDIRRERDIALDELDARPTLTRTVTKVLRDDCPVCNCSALGSDFRAVYNGMRKRAHETATNPGAPPPD